MNGECLNKNIPLFLFKNSIIMIHHPLHEFISLLEDKGLTKMLNHFDDHKSFAERRQFNNAELDPFYICDVEWLGNKGCYVITELRSDDEPIEKLVTKEIYVSDLFEGVSKRFMSRVRNTYLSLQGNEIKNKTNVLVKELNHIRQTIPEEYQPFNDIIRSSVRKLIIFLKGYLDEPLDIINESSTKMKLKWHGKLNILITLFFELADGSNNLKVKFLMEDRQTLKKFILDNFTNKDGSDLSETSIYKILSDPEKRSKNSITLIDGEEKTVKHVLEVKATD
jgi:hypothetical protein